MDYIQNLQKELERIIRAAEMEIKKVARAAVVQSFKNGIEVGKGKKVSKDAKTNRKTMVDKSTKPEA